MKRMRLLAALALLACVAAPIQALAAPCVVKPSDNRVISETIRSLYAALAKDEALDGIVSPGFYAFEGDKRFTGSELSAVIRQTHAKGVTLVWKLDTIDIHAGCDVAWAAWENHGAAIDASGSKPVTWYESAGLHRDGARWVIDFLHAHRVNVPK